MSLAYLSYGMNGYGMPNGKLLGRVIHFYMLVFFFLKYRDTKISEVRIEDQVVNVAMYIATPNLEAVPLLETCNTR